MRLRQLIPTNEESLVLTAAARTYLDAALDVASWMHKGGSFRYSEWLSSLLNSDLLRTLSERVRSGWELPPIIRLQCIAASRAAAAEPLPLSSSCGSGGGIATGCNILLREAVAAGIDLPVELRSLTTSADKKAGSVAAGGAPNAILRTDALGEKASGVSLLLQLQRRRSRAR